MGIYTDLASLTKAAATILDNAISPGKAIDNGSLLGVESTSGETDAAYGNRDIVSLSAAASAALSDKAATPSPLAGSDIEAMAETALGEGQSTSFTTTYAADGRLTQTVTGALASIVDQIDTTGKATIQPDETAAELDFAKAYAAQKSAGLVGSFYTGHTASDYTLGMSDAEAAAFTAAFDDRTLTIATPQQAGRLENAQGAAYTGGETANTTVYESAVGGGEESDVSGPQMYWDVSSVMQKHQYAFTTSSAIFGDFVVAYGGPASGAKASG